jgi:signal transduction histidine kinase
MNLNLLTHNIIFLAGGTLNVVLPMVVIFMRRKKLDTAIITFALMSWSVAVFQIFQVLGANASSADLSRRLFMFNLTDIWIGAFMTHWFLAVIGKDRDPRERVILKFIYGFAVILFAACLIYPKLFLLDSVPKMYFPFYYNPGPLYGVMVAYFFITQIYYFAKLVVAYRREQEPVLKNRYRYVLIAMLYAYVTGQLAFLLVFNIQVDPMWASLCGLYPLLLAYAMVRYELMEVKVIAKRALIYAILVAVLIGFISLSSQLTSIIQRAAPSFPSLVIPLISSLIGVAAGFFIWMRLREDDVLKYEFVTIIAHKFRTPLTEVKWSVDEMLKMGSDPAIRSGLQDVDTANEKLIGLTGTLVDLAESDAASQSHYTFKDLHICELVSTVAESYRPAFEKKGISFAIQCPVSDVVVKADQERIKFILQTLLENALAYTPKDGKVTVTATASSNKVSISISDTGVGIKKEDIRRIFSKFYRTKRAMLADTEGFGIGLYLAQAIAKRHGGRIEVYSEGEGKGSTFTLILREA